MMHELWLVPVGLFVGCLGTLVGAGGGFLLAPMLLLVYPHDSPDTIASISLAVVFLNASSGTYAYSKMKRVDYKSGFLLSAATIPGAVIGAITTSYIPRHTFDRIFAFVLIGGAALILWRPRAQALATGSFHRVVTDADGKVHEYRYNPWLAAALSLIVGFMSSLLGIGGGIIHVPVLTSILGFPVHIATATSHFALAMMSAAGTITHAITGTLAGTAGRILLLGVGVLVGAQFGARLSTRVNDTWILRALALALVSVALRLLIS